MTHQRLSLSYVSDLISDPAEMVAVVSGWADRFTPQDGPRLDDMSARYATFVADGGDYDTLKGFLALDLLPAPPRWLVLQQYQPGDYSLPRRLHMDLPVSREEVSWVATYPLTRDAADGVTIWGGLNLKNFYVQINRYDVGDYVLPHRDTLQQGLYMLTSSERNSLVVQDATGRPVRIPDRAGTFITFDPNAWHWVDPVVDHERFTMVTIPALPHP